MEQVSLGREKRPLVHGVDTLRIAAAIWVVFGHGGFPDIGAEIGRVSPAFGKLVHSVLATSFNGAAAVVIFFIISGFCIHYPNVGKPALDWKTFLLRRACRIGIPMAIVSGIAVMLGPRYLAGVSAVFWSLYCELIYYALYPILFWSLKRVKLEHVLYGSVVASLVVLLVNSGVTVISHLGISLTWLFCAPAWLLGALLAQNFSFENRRILPGSLWLWRAAAILIGVVSEFARFHLTQYFGPLWTLVPIPLFGYFWIRDELLAYRPSPVRGALEAAGKGSYTLYLIHMLVLVAFASYVETWDALVLWLARSMAMAAAATAFYALVERPSHLLAQKIKLRPRGGAPVHPAPAAIITSTPSTDFDHAANAKSRVSSDQPGGDLP